jgi:membrane-associated phospholipid phosphatase
VKDKREFRRIQLWQWLLFFAGAGILILASFYLDAPVRGWMTRHQGPVARSFMEGVSRYGDWPEHVALGLILLTLAWTRGNKSWMRVFVAMILACALAGAAARVVKISTGRARPSVQSEEAWSGPRLSSKHNSFPSGHTAASVAFFATLILAGWRIGTPLLAIPLLIAFSRMYVAAHYFSDAVAGALIGIVAAICVVQWKPLKLDELKSRIRN